MVSSIKWLCAVTMEFDGNYRSFYKNWIICTKKINILMPHSKIEFQYSPLKFTHTAGKRSESLHRTHTRNHFISHSSCHRRRITATRVQYHVNLFLGKKHTHTKWLQHLMHFNTYWGVSCPSVRLSDLYYKELLSA